jgi:hypothetical protein
MDSDSYVGNFILIIKIIIFIIIIVFVIRLSNYSIFNENFSNNINYNNINYKRIYLSDTKFYFLTMNTESTKSRKNHILNEFAEYSPIEVNPVLGLSRNKSGSTGFGRMIDAGLSDQNRNVPFQPFIILEDDSSKMRDFPEYIDIPEDTDILYIGLHGWGYSKNEPINIVYSENVDNDIIRVKNLLALHGLIVCSALGASLIQRSMIESFYLNKPWDIPITHAQPFYKVYALKVPLVYQDKRFGGKESVTKIKASKNWFVKMPEYHINNETATNLMKYQIL